MSCISLTAPALKQTDAISLTELKQFYSIDRELYAKLVLQLEIDSDTSKKIGGFWKWLETKGYTNFVYKSLERTESSSSLTWLNGLALESIFCLGCLHQESLTLSGLGSLPLMSRVCNKGLSLEFVFANRESAHAGITEFVRDVCDRAFIDIVLENDLNYQDDRALVPDSGLLQPQVTLLAEEGNSNNSANRRVNEADSERTLFVTFSRGHPITREELFIFFTVKYGKSCVEDIIMDNAHYPPLYARVIVRWPAYITLILGENELKQFNIHHKDVRVRRYVPKSAAAEACKFN